MAREFYILFSILLDYCYDYFLIHFKKKNGVLLCCSFSILLYISNLYLKAADFTRRISPDDHYVYGTTASGCLQVKINNPF